MGLVFLITHPDVVVDPAAPVTGWDLSERGRARLDAMLRHGWVGTVDRVHASQERKARTTAERIAAHTGVPVDLDGALGEIDRSATGFLPPPEFDAVVEACFDAPEQSARGWERAVDAQARIVQAVRRALGRSPDEEHVAIVSHGGVGALLLCHLRGEPIRRAVLPPGQGYYFVFRHPSGELLHRWTPIEVDIP
jgi:broad specificity phosphatase PhoE